VQGELEEIEPSAAVEPTGLPDVEHVVAQNVEPDPYDERADPYAVLRLTPSATWDEIVANYRRLARWWHPDGLGAATEWGRAACEAKIRQLNGAYAELRIRRDR
jgi:preprotein translocase subunit Sec63